MRVLAFLLAVALLAGCKTDADGLAAAASPATENPLQPDADRPADTDSPGATPYVEFESPDELVADIAALDAEVVLVNYWATWCGPCRVEFPDLVRYDADHEGEGVEVRFVSVDLPSDGEAVQAFLDDHAVSDPSYLYAGPGELIGQLDPAVAGIVPVTMVFDGEGTLLKSHMGVLTYDAIDQLVADARST